MIFTSHLMVIYIYCFHIIIPMVIYNKNSKELMNSAIKLLSNITINNPLTIVTSSFNIQNKSVVNIDDTYENYLQLESITKYVNNPNNSEITNPRVYIYNSHQLENYGYENIELYGLTPNVMVASYLLQDSLNKKNIQCIWKEKFIHIKNVDNTHFIKVFSPVLCMEHFLESAPFFIYG